MFFPEYYELLIIGHRFYIYCIAGKFGGGSLANLANPSSFAKLKSSKLVLKINNLLADLLICQTLFHQMLEKSQFAKLSHHQTFPPPNFPAIRYYHTV